MISFLGKLWALLTGQGEKPAPSPLYHLRQRAERELEDDADDDPLMHPTLDEEFGVADYLIHDDRYDRPDDTSFWN